MHPKEFKEEKAGTGRLTHLCLQESEIRMGVSFDQDDRVNEILDDPTLYAVLLYPGVNAANLTRQPWRPAGLAGRRLVVFLLDGTWACARKMLKLSQSLQGLPRIMFDASQRSRFIIKQQPQEGCLSTLEATHELLTVLERQQLDRYDRPDQLLQLFERMQSFQIACAADPHRTGYRRRPYTAPAERARPRDTASARRDRFIPPGTETP